MRLASFALVMVGAALLAGCASGSGGAGEPTSSSGPPTASTEPPRPLVLPVVVDLPWDGSTVAGAWVCDNVAGQGCMSQPSADAYGVTHEWNVPEGNLTGGNASLTWTAASQASAQLTLGVEWFNGSCDACGWTHFAPDISGPSPIEFPIPGGLRTGPGDKVRVWVYVPIFQPAGPEYVGGSVPQDFHLDGSMTFLVDAAKAPRMH